MPKEKVILKDVLFNEKSVSFISNNIKNSYEDFDDINFINQTLIKFPELELKERINWITTNLENFLPKDFKTAVNILIESLPKELDSEKTDDDFWYFILSSYWEFIANNWCNKKYLDFSLETFEIFTKRFSMEFAIRPFLKEYQDETLNYVEKWSKDGNYHVRRLSSEWIRPNLPWWWKINIWLENNLEILDNLYTDKTRYVLRSVANSLNDITKIDSQIVLDRLIKWKKSWLQTKDNIDFLIKHSLRSELKKWNPNALSLLWYMKPNLKINNLKFINKLVNIWESAEFSFEISSNIEQKLLINYNLYFVTANWKLSPKVFHIWKKTLKKWETILVNKKHPIKKMTTKKIYNGHHFIEVIINWELFLKKSFEVKV